MRSIDRFIWVLLWLCLAIGLVTLAWTALAILTTHDGPLLGIVGAGVWPQIIVLSIAGGGLVLAAVSILIWDRTQRGAQSVAVYVLAALTVITTATSIITSFMIWASRYVTV